MLSVNAAPTVAAAALTAIRGRADLLRTYPRIGRPALNGSHVLRVRKTPYLLFYRIEDDRIEILRIRHDREELSA